MRINACVPAHGAPVHAVIVAAEAIIHMSCVRTEAQMGEPP